MSPEIGLDKRDMIIAAYVIYYGRPADPEGLDWWVANPEGYTFAETINAFGTSDEYKSNFGDLTHTELINNIYQQAFNRNAETDGLNHYLAQLESGEETLATIAYAINGGAQNGDAAVLAFKKEIAEVFTELLRKTVCEGKDYGSHTYDSAGDALLLRDFLLTVTDPLQAEAYKADITDIAYDHFLIGVPRCDLDEIAPVFSSGDTATVEENAPVSTAVYSSQAVDNAAGGVSYSLRGVDAVAFAIDETSGVVTLLSSADFETQSLYNIEVIATDASDNAASQAVTVSVIDVDEIPPVFYSGSYEQKNENLPRFNPVYNAQAVDSSGEIDVGITYTLPHLKWDNGLFTISHQGVVYFRQIPDYENPLDGGKDNSYTILIEASDEYGNIAERIVNLKILDVDENPDPQPEPEPEPEPVISSIHFKWNSDTSKFTAEASSSHTMVSVTVKDENNQPVTIGTPKFELDGGDGLITFDFTDNSFGFGETTANFDNWTFTFTDSSALTVTATYDVIITSEKDIQGDQDAEIFLLRPWDVNDESRNVWGSETKYDYGATDLADQIFMALPDAVPNDQYITPTVGSHIEGTSGVFTTVSFAFTYDTYIKLILAEPGGTSTAQIYGDSFRQIGPLEGVVTMIYVDGIVGDRGNDELTGNSQNNVIYGADGADILKGRRGNDFLSGGKGHDVLFGGPGINTIHGDSGFDTASYDGFSIDLTIDLRTDTHTVKDTESTSNEVFDTLEGIEKIIGGSGNDTFLAKDDSRVVWFIGGDGDDHLHGYKNDRLEGGNDADSFYLDFTADGGVYVLDYNEEEGDIIKSTTTIPIVIDTVANKGAFATINSGGVLDAGFTFLAEEEETRNVTQLYAVRDLLRDNNVTLSTPSQKSLLMVTNGTASAIWYIEGDGGDLEIKVSEMTMVVFLAGVTSMDDVTFVDLF